MVLVKEEHEIDFQIDSWNVECLYEWQDLVTEYIKRYSQNLKDHDLEKDTAAVCNKALQFYERKRYNNVFECDDEDELRRLLLKASGMLCDSSMFQRAIDGHACDPGLVISVVERVHDASDKSFSTVKPWQVYLLTKCCISC